MNDSQKCHFTQMTHSRSLQGSWEEEDVENPVGRAGWVFNTLTNELTVCSTIEVAEGEKAPWHCFEYYVDAAVLLDGVASVCCGAFRWFGRMESVYVPKSVTSIGAKAFFYCEVLTSITLPNSVKEIGEEAFFFCNALTSITLPGGVETLGANPFLACGRLSEISVVGGGESLQMV